MNSAILEQLESLQAELENGRGAVVFDPAGTVRDAASAIRYLIEENHRIRQESVSNEIYQAIAKDLQLRKSQLEQARAERDKAIRYLRECVDCPSCMHQGKECTNPDDDMNCEDCEKCACGRCNEGSNYEWEGLK